MCISAQDAYASEEEATLLVASYFFARLGIKAGAFIKLLTKAKKCVKIYAPRRNASIGLLAFARKRRQC
jgi:hypothetical protein